MPPPGDAAAKPGARTIKKKRVVKKGAPDFTAEREMRGRRIHASRPTLAADTTWTSDTDTVFDGTYRHLLRAAKAKERQS